MKRTARLDGTSDSGVYSPIQYVRDPRGLTADELLKMRESGMTNAAIARAVNSKAWYIEKLIGKTPKQLVKKAQAEGALKAVEARMRNKAESEDNENNNSIPALHVQLGEFSVGAGFSISGLDRLTRLRAIVRELYLRGDVFDYHIMPQNNAINILWRDQNKVLGTIEFGYVKLLVEELMEVMASVEEFARGAEC